MIEEKGLARDIDRVAGAGFLDAVKAAHEGLAEAIGVGATPVHYTRGELVQALNELRISIADYCLQVAAEVDRDDPASVCRFRAAMMPIDRFRADRAAAPNENEDELDEPVVTPVVTPAPSPMRSPRRSSTSRRGESYGVRTVAAGTRAPDASDLAAATPRGLDVRSARTSMRIYTKERFAWASRCSSHTRSRLPPHRTP